MNNPNNFMQFMNSMQFMHFCQVYETSEEADSAMKHFVGQLSELPSDVQQILNWKAKFRDRVVYYGSKAIWFKNKKHFIEASACGRWVYVSLFCKPDEDVIRAKMIAERWN